jgi:hypothetical protein
MKQLSNLEKVIEILYENGHDKHAKDIEGWSKFIDSDEATLRNEAIDKIVGVCSVRSFGDLNIKTMNGWAWNTLLEKVNNSVSKKYLKK